MPMQFLSMNNTGGTEIPYERRTSATYMTGLALNPQDSLRLRRYEEHWRFYTGIHWSFRREDGEPLVTANYCRAVVNKKASFLVGKGMTLQVPEPLAEITKPPLEEVWKYNNKMRLLLEFAITGGVTGDVFALVTYEPPPTARLMINPYTQGRIRIRLLGSHQIFPKWNPLNREALEFVRIITEVKDNTPPSAVEQVSTPRNPYQRQNTQAGMTGVNRPRRYVEDIYPDRIVEGWDGEGPPTVRPNELGEIPLIHMINEPCPGEYFGMSDLDGIIDIQREFNEKMTDISDIVNYHCVDEKTEALTKQGWKKHSELTEGTEILCLDPETDAITWQPITTLNTYQYTGELVKWDNRISACTTPNHRWLAEREVGRPENKRYERQFVRTSVKEGNEIAALDLCGGSLLRVGGGVPTHFPLEETYDEELVQTLGWWITEGCVHVLPSGSYISTLAQSESVNSRYVNEIRDLQEYWQDKGETFRENRPRPGGVVTWYLGTELTAKLLELAPDKVLTPGFLLLLTQQQAETLMETLIDADGSRTASGRTVWYQNDQRRIDMMQMLAAMLAGQRTRSRVNCNGGGATDFYRTGTIEALSTVKRARKLLVNDKLVWCPTVATGVWFARRNGYTYWTGNSAPVTIITGARAKQLEKGPKAMWAGLPAEAKVFNLELGGDLGASHKYLEFVRQVMFDLSGLPEGSLGRIQPISNTSAAALQVQFQPLIETTERKAPGYERGIEEINYYILRYWQLLTKQMFPIDLCNSCGGRIVTTRMRGKNGRVVEKKTCYLVDPQTLEFLNPEQVEIMWKRRFSYGIESRRMPFGQVKAENLLEAASYWDPQPVVDLQAKAEEDKARAKELEHHNAEQDSMQSQPEQVFNETTAQWETSEGPPKREPPPEELEPPIEVKPERLPPHDMDIPEEPEEVDVNVYTWNADAKTFEEEALGKMLIVPTGCKRPTYLSPYETTVTMKSALPRDKEKEANLYAVYQKNQWMSRRWCQTHLDEDVQPSVEDKQIADDIPFILAAQGLPDASQVQGSQGVQGDFGVGTNNGAPLPPGAGPGRGNKVVPGDNMASPKPSANAVPGQRV